VLSGASDNPVHETLLVGLFGIPGVEAGKAGSRAKQSSAAAAESATNHEQHVISMFLGNRSSLTNVHVAIHAWASPLSEVARSLNASYRNHLFASKFDFDGPKDHIVGQVTSMAAVLSLLDTSPRHGAKQPIVVLMRHDVWFFAGLELRQLVLDNETIVTGTWCSPVGVHNTSDHCGPLKPTIYDGIHDYFFIGEIEALKRFIFNAQTRIARNGVVNQRAHFELDMHAQRLGLKQRGLWQSHPSAVSYMTYTLYRWRHDRLSFRDELQFEANETGICNSAHPTFVCYDAKVPREAAIGRDPGPF
jgi:hypothetical protein